MEFQFDSLASFIAMDGHGPYVWASYGVALLVLATLAIVPSIRQKALRAEIGRKLRQEEARRRAAQSARTAQTQPEMAD
ncbi:heme exporter protein CcmD [Microbulbifer elongatus]|uniref:Heme exporter protein D n=1 Tax=Microbulbifer elongatus TaxID=86173 RepID=A0ABT1P5W3_9GAMM|nr:heme exporter protein CcmD [Microbulbifer elongatus]MCQ3830491.1 heme exporter protein CcmD [Microbulbifer elongatus]